MARISAEDEGLYQQDIKAGEVLTVEVEPRTRITPEGIQVIVHDGDQPVYVQRGTTVEPREQSAQMVMRGSYLDVDNTPMGRPYTVAITSEADATVSVARS